MKISISHALEWSDLLEIPAAPKDDYEMEAELKAMGTSWKRN
jgi:hypothetical protein